MSKLDPEDRKLLRDILEVTKESRAASVRAAAAAEKACDDIRTLSEIIGREVSPLGQLRADIIEKLEAAFNRQGELALKLGELEQWRDEHEGEHRRAASNGR